VTSLLVLLKKSHNNNVSDIAIFVLKRDVKLQLTNLTTTTTLSTTTQVSW